MIPTSSFTRGLRLFPYQEPALLAGPVILRLPFGPVTLMSLLPALLFRIGKPRPRQLFLGFGIYTSPHDHADGRPRTHRIPGE